MFSRSDEISRRCFIDWLAAATLGVSAFSALASSPAAASAVSKNNKKLIFLYMDGGMSHLDTFDPHPGTEEAGPVSAIATNVDGIQISAFFPNLARHMGNLSIIRSMYSTQGAHAQGKYLMHTGYQQRGSIVHPTLGSWSMHHQGKINQALPGNVVIAPYTDYPYAGWLPPELGAIPLGDPNKGLQNSNRPAWTTPEKYHDQLEMASVFDRAFQARFKQSSIDAYNTFYDEALALMKSEDLKAFDITQEPQKVRERYGTTSKFGQGCLLARRLIEHDVRCVEVVKGGWDTHAEMPAEQALDLDRGFAALMQDLTKSGLIDSTIVVLATEFGRNPSIKADTMGRDHWAKAFSCIIGGGDIKTGQVVGATDRGYEVTTEKILIPDLHATIGAAMGMPIKEVVMSESGRPFNVGYKGTPIAGLI